MKYEYYKQIVISDGYQIFDFISTGINGDIKKRVVFSLIQLPNLYNLSFGDLDADGEIDDYSISNNNDMAKVLATIAAIVEIFLNKHPTYNLFFRGSTAERTRLYRMAIGVNLIELSEMYDIYGMIEDSSVVKFEKNLNYYAFIISKKL